MITFKIVILFQHLARLLLGDKDVKFKAVIMAFIVILPLDGFISSPYGLRIDPFTQQLRLHEGIDIKADYATPVKTVANGVVTFSGKKNGYGRVVVIDHGKGFETYYAHLGRAFV